MPWTGRRITDRPSQEDERHARSAETLLAALLALSVGAAVYAGAEALRILLRSLGANL